MKFTLTITDMTSDEMTTVANQLGIVEVAQNTPQVTVNVEDDDDGIDAVGDLDSAGLPWDERIHASSKKQNKDGTWKSRRGVDDATKDEVEAELRGQVKQESLPAEATPVVEQPAPAQVAIQQPPVEQPAPAPAPVATPQPPVEQPAPAPAPVATPQGGNTMQSLMQKFQQLLAEKKIQPNFAMTMVQEMNVMYGTNFQSIVDFGQNQAMLDAAFKYINEKVQ